VSVRADTAPAWWAGTDGYVSSLRVEDVEAPFGEALGRRSLVGRPVAGFSPASQAESPGQLGIGIAGLVLSRNPGLTEAQVRRILESSADKIRPDANAYDSRGHSDRFGFGRINAERAIRSTSFPSRIAFSKSRYRDSRICRDSFAPALGAFAGRDRCAPEHIEVDDRRRSRVDRARIPRSRAFEFLTQSRLERSSATRIASRPGYARPSSWTDRDRRSRPRTRSPDRASGR